ncbi:MAG: hypothetical protein PHS37_08710 [Candidatus Omnitrophica bacterium]|nr:hypothetical protein [Candidatus Omnitrophota bacterium]
MEIFIVALICLAAVFVLGRHLKNSFNENEACKNCSLRKSGACGKCTIKKS